MPETEATQFWEARYADNGRVWSGSPNQALVAVVGDLPAGRALDLGCGEGGDSIWLARRGWQVTGVDISTTALARSESAARRIGIPGGQIRWLAGDLATWQADDSYDLVTACFLQSPIDFPRVEVLCRAAGAVAPAGYLLIVSHAAAPPWAPTSDEHRHYFPTPEEEIAALALAGPEWETVTAEIRPRQAIGPDGQQAVLDDAIVLLRRR